MAPPAATSGRLASGATLPRSRSGGSRRAGGRSPGARWPARSAWRVGPRGRRGSPGGRPACSCALPPRRCGGRRGRRGDQAGRRSPHGRRARGAGAGRATAGPSRSARWGARSGPDGPRSPRLGRLPRPGPGPAGPPSSSPAVLRACTASRGAGSWPRGRRARAAAHRGVEAGRRGTTARPPGAGGGSCPAARRAGRRRRPAPPARRRGGAAASGGPRVAGPAGESRPTTCNRCASRAGASSGSASGRAGTSARRPACGPVDAPLRWGVWPERGRRHRRSSGGHSARRDAPAGAAGRSDVAGPRGPSGHRGAAGARSGRPAGSAGSRGGPEPMPRPVAAGRRRVAAARERAGRAGRSGARPGRGAVGAVERMGGVSGGLGRDGRSGLRGRRRPGGCGGGERAASPGACINCLIRSTIDGSRLARALTLTSSPHFWMRSSRSGLFSPNSFANSWTRVDKGNSSWMGPRPKATGPARTIGIVNSTDRSCQGQFPGASRRGFPRVARGLRGATWQGTRGRNAAAGPRGASWLVHFRISLHGRVGRARFRRAAIGGCRARARPPHRPRPTVRGKGNRSSPPR